jgi:hypothetical protein
MARVASCALVEEVARMVGGSCSIVPVWETLPRVDVRSRFGRATTIGCNRYQPAHAPGAVLDSLEVPRQASNATRPDTKEDDLQIQFTTYTTTSPKE